LHTGQEMLLPACAVFENMINLSGDRAGIAAVFLDNAVGILPKLKAVGRFADFLLERA